jgi:type III pantothenate kinase
MLLAFDIGNTTIAVGGFQEDELRFELQLKTDPGRTTDEYAAVLFPLLDRLSGAPFRAEQAIVSSVAPSVTAGIVAFLERYLKLAPHVVGPGTKTGMPIKISEPNAVGADRIVNAVAARVLFGAPALIIDFGTATSFDFVAKNGSYQGGIIAPGVEIALEALVRRTAKLPRIELNWPKSIVGKNTVGAMQSGSVVGYACLLDGLIERVIQEEGPIEQIISTGSLGKLFTERCKRIRSYEPHLTLRGLRILARMNLEAREQ